MFFHKEIKHRIPVNLSGRRSNKPKTSNLKSQISNVVQAEGRRKQTKVCFQYAEAPPTFKRSLNLKPQTSNPKKSLTNFSARDFEYFGRK